MTTEERKLLTCRKCNEVNEPGMLFCIHCGQGLSASADKMRTRSTIIMGGKCPSCGKEDDLNMRFCIFCSSLMHPDTEVRPGDKLSRMDLSSPIASHSKPTTEAALQFQSAVRKSPTKKALNLLPIGLIAGAIFGGLLAIPGFKVSNLIERVWLSGTWPARSVTVYTKHPFAQLTLYQPSDSKAFYLAETDSKGAARFLNLEPGDYNLKIFGKGYRTAFEQVAVEANRPTVIGYGENHAIALERDPNAVDTDTTGSDVKSDASAVSSTLTSDSASKPAGSDPGSKSATPDPNSNSTSDSTASATKPSDAKSANSINR